MSGADYVFQKVLELDHRVFDLTRRVEALTEAWNRSLINAVPPPPPPKVPTFQPDLNLWWINE